MYRAAVEEVPDQSFECQIGKADILRTGKDVTLIGWGTQVHVLKEVADIAKTELNVDCEVIDMVSILPWDKQTVCEVRAFVNSIETKKNSNFILNRFLYSQSAKKTGRVLVAHEAPLTNGFGAELAATIQVRTSIIMRSLRMTDKCFLQFLAFSGRMFFVLGSSSTTCNWLGYTISTCL